MTAQTATRKPKSSTETPIWIASALLPPASRAGTGCSRTRTTQPGIPTTSASEINGQNGQKYPSPVSAQITTRAATMLVATRERMVSARRRLALFSALDLTTPSASPASKRVASHRDTVASGPSRWTMSTTKASPAAANGSVSANVSMFERPKTSALSTHRYQIGSESSCSAKPTTDSTISAIGQATSRCACCFQNAGSLRTLKPRLQNPVPAVDAAGRVSVPRRSRARLASAWARSPTPARRPIRSGTTSGVIARTRVVVQPASSRVKAATPRPSVAT